MTNNYVRYFLSIVDRHSANSGLRLVW